MWLGSFIHLVLCPLSILCCSLIFLIRLVSLSFFCIISPATWDIFPMAFYFFLWVFHWLSGYVISAFRDIFLFAFFLWLKLVVFVVQFVREFHLFFPLTFTSSSKATSLSFPVSSGFRFTKMRRTKQLLASPSL